MQKGSEKLQHPPSLQLQSDFAESPCFSLLANGRSTQLQDAWEVLRGQIWFWPKQCSGICCVFIYLVYSFILDVCNIYTYRSTFIFIHMYAPVNYVFGGFNSKPFFSTRFWCSSCLEQYLETRQLWHLLSTNKVMGSIMCKSSVTDVYSYRMVP